MAIEPKVDEVAMIVATLKGLSPEKQEAAYVEFEKECGPEAVARARTLLEAERRAAELAAKLEAKEAELRAVEARLAAKEAKLKEEKGAEKRSPSVAKGPRLDPGTIRVPASPREALRQGAATVRARPVE